MLREDVQFVKKHKYPPAGKIGKSYQAHTPIKIPSGQILLPVGVHANTLPINETPVAYGQGWEEEHLKYLTVGYRQAPYFEVLYPQIKKIIRTKFSSISDLNITTLVWGLIWLLCEEADFDVLTITYANNLLKKSKIRLREIRLASETKTIKEIGSTLSANDKIISIIKEMGATEDYCGGTAHTAYMDEELFKKNKIKVTVQDWKCRQYPQQFPKIGFVPNLSIVDLLMNVTPKRALEILTA